MDKLLLETLNSLNQAVELYTEALLNDKLTKTNAKHMLVSELCRAINSFAMLVSATYMYTQPCTNTIYAITTATNTEQIIKACLSLNLWAAETMHELNESEATI